MEKNKQLLAACDWSVRSREMSGISTEEKRKKKKNLKKQACNFSLSL